MFGNLRKLLFEVIDFCLHVVTSRSLVQSIEYDQVVGFAVNEAVFQYGLYGYRMIMVLRLVRIIS